MSGWNPNSAPAVNTSDAESASKSLSDVREYVKQAHEAGESTAKTLEKVQADLSTAIKQFEEMKARGSREVSESDKTLRRFKATHTTGSGATQAEKGDILLTGRVDQQTKQWIPGLLDQTTDTGNDWAKDMRKAIGDLNIITTIKGDARHAQIARARVSRLLDQAPAPVKGAKSLGRLKAFVDVAGSGGESIIDLGIPDLLDNNPLIRSPLADRLMVHSMAAKEEVIPAMTTGLRPYKYSGATVDDPAPFTSSSLQTQDRRRTAAGMAVYTKWDRDAAEDSILNAVDVLRREISLAIRDGREDCLINGDTTATHQDDIANWDVASRWGATGLGGSADHRRAYDGFRDYCLANTWNGAAAAVDQGSAQTWDGIMGLAARLSGTGGLSNSNTVLLTSKAFLIKIMLFDEFKQANWFGAPGTINTGALMRFGPHELIISDFMGSDLNASGVFDNTTTTKTGLLWINLDRWEMNRRMGTVVEMDTDIIRNQGRLVSRVRESLWSMEAASATASNQDAVFAYNLTS